MNARIEALKKRYEIAAMALERSARTFKRAELRCTEARNAYLAKLHRTMNANSQRNAR